MKKSVQFAFKTILRFWAPSKTQILGTQNMRRKFWIFVGFFLT